MCWNGLGGIPRGGPPPYRILSRWRGCTIQGSPQVEGVYHTGGHPRWRCTIQGSPQVGEVYHTGVSPGGGVPYRGSSQVEVYHTGVSPGAPPPPHTGGLPRWRCSKCTIQGSPQVEVHHTGVEVYHTGGGGASYRGSPQVEVYHTGVSPGGGLVPYRISLGRSRGCTTVESG